MSRKLHRGRTRVFHKRRFPVKAIVWILGGRPDYSSQLFRREIYAGGTAGTGGILQPVRLLCFGRGGWIFRASGGFRAGGSGGGRRCAGRISAAFHLAGRRRPGYGAVGGRLPPGFNAVLFDLKGSDGRLAYVSATPLALQAQSAADGALPLEDLKNLLQAVKDKGMKPIARLYAFQDPYAPSRLPTAKIAYAGHEGWTWYDNDPDNGGKPWLNPYLEDAGGTSRICSRS